MIRKTLILLALMLTAVSVYAQDEEEDTVLMYVSPMTQPCIGVGEQDCLIVRFEDETDLTFFFDDIEGFEYEQGFEHILEVAITERENPPADASSLQYELVEVVQKYSASLEGKIWELQTLYGDDIEDPSRYQLTSTLDESFLKADCNTVGTIITLAPFNIETTFSTQAFCDEDSRDIDFINAINEVTMMSIENGELILQSSEGQLRFAPPSIEGIAWELESVGGIASFALMTEDTPHTLFIEDNSARMTIICNNAGADVSFEGAVISFSEIETEEESCENPPISDPFPPEDAVYHITDMGQLNLATQDSVFYTFNNPNAETE